MEKAVLKTIVYADIFDYPLLAWEVHKWLILKKASLKDVERSLKKLIKKNKIETFNDYYFLKGRRSLVKKRLLKEQISKSHFDQINSLSKIIKVIPWIKLVGISGSLAMKNSDESDDIDLFIITQKNRLFLSRLLLLFILELLGIRRKKGDQVGFVSKKVCANILLEEDNLEQYNKDIYLAHEVLQMTPLWQRNNIYSKFLEENHWAYKFLPNWLTTTSFLGPVVPKDNKKARIKKVSLISTGINFFEQIAKNFQLTYMGTPKGKERISPNALYFHPHDSREKVLKSFQKRLDKTL